MMTKTQIKANKMWTDVMTDDREKRILDEYKQWQGTRHKMGGSGSRGVDCSGFVKELYRDVFNIDLPRTTKAQVNRYLAQRYTGVSVASHAGPVPFLIAEQYEGQKIVWIDPRRVRSIHLLFAGNGGKTPSRRKIPGRQPLPPESSHSNGNAA